MFKFGELGKLLLGNKEIKFKNSFPTSEAESWIFRLALFEKFMNFSFKVATSSTGNLGLIS